MSSMNAYNSAQVIGHPMVRGGQRSGVPVKRVRELELTL